MGDTYQALAIYKQLAVLRSGSVHPYLRMAEVYLTAKDKAGAIDALRQALTVRPDAIEAQRRQRVDLAVDSGDAAFEDIEQVERRDVTGIQLCHDCGCRFAYQGLVRCHLRLRFFCVLAITHNIAVGNIVPQNESLHAGK